MSTFKAISFTLKQHYHYLWLPWNISDFMERILSGFPYDVLRLLCLNSLRVSWKQSVTAADCSCELALLSGSAWIAIAGTPMGTITGAERKGATETGPAASADIMAEVRRPKRVFTAEDNEMKRYWGKARAKWHIRLTSRELNQWKGCKTVTTDIKLEVLDYLLSCMCLVVSLAWFVLANYQFDSF